MTEEYAHPIPVKRSHASWLARSTAVTLLKVAIVPLSLMTRALERAEAESNNTAEAARKAIGHCPPRVTRLRRRHVSTTSITNIEVRGRTKRCLYLAARASVADRFVAVAGSSAEEDVDCN